MSDMTFKIPASEELEIVMETIKSRYPLFSDEEIVKLAITELYNDVITEYADTNSCDDFDEFDEIDFDDADFIDENDEAKA